MAGRERGREREEDEKLTVLYNAATIGKTLATRPIRSDSFQRVGGAVSPFGPSMAASVFGLKRDLFQDVFSRG